MAKLVLLMGTSGSGKSTSMRNFKSDELALVNVMGKPLPFKGKFDSTIVTRDYEQIKKAIFSTEKKVIVVDDSSYLITNYFMENHVTATDKYGMYDELADRQWDLLRWAENKLPDDKVVIFIMHENETDSGKIIPKTIGKLLDDKVCLEGLFSIVLRSEVHDGKYQFLTHGQGVFGAKTPIGMFEDDYIDNDLKLVVDTINNYYKEK